MKKLYYNKKVTENIDSSILNAIYFDEWYKIVKEVLLNDEFQKRKLFMHHHNLSVWDHSILVSYKSFVLAKYYSADERVCAIAGLLHDFYPYAWLMNDDLAKLNNGEYVKEVNVKRSLFKMHGFVHAREAAENYVKFFPELEDKKITNSIKRHMFPLNIIPPRYKEGMILTLVDKVNSVHELPSISFMAKKVKNKTSNIFKKIWVRK